MNLPPLPLSEPMGKAPSAPPPDTEAMKPRLLSDGERQSRLDYGIRSPYPEDNPGLTSYNLGRGLAHIFQGPNLMTDTLSHGPAVGGLTGGAAGAAAGAAGAGLYNMFADEPVSAAKASGISGLIGALLGAYGGHLYKQGSAGPGILSEAAQQGGYDVGAIQQAVANLSPSDSANLASMLRGAFGAAAGAILLQFLLGKGLLAGAGGALLGGYLGYQHQTPSIDNYASYW